MVLASEHPGPDLWALAMYCPDFIRTQNDRKAQPGRVAVIWILTFGISKRSGGVIPAWTG